ncbi:MAG: transglutaminase-like cysteine peptidase [Burkholderiales bacterium]
MLRLRQTLVLILSVIFISAISAADLARVDEAEIQRLMDTVGQSDTEKKIIHRRLTAWKTMIESPQNKGAEDGNKLRLVNDFVAETPFYCDPVQWCLEDYWAKPLEFLANDGGDCEDFAIAKYYALRALGVPDDKLRIVYAGYRQGAFSGAHMVLAYYPTPDGDPMILDNINPDVLPGSRRADLTPVFSFNTQGLWSAKELKGRDTSNPHKSWGDVWRKVQTDTTIKFLTPEQRKSSECQALRGRVSWCR